jgi:hypothetical protein
MFFGLLGRKDAPPANPMATAPPIRESRGGPLARACADALAAITAARPAVAAAQIAERLSLHPLVERPPADRRVDPLMGASTGRYGSVARVVGQAPASIPTMPPARPAAAGLASFMPKPLDH